MRTTTLYIEITYAPKFLFNIVIFWNLNFLNCSNKLTWENDQKKNCRSRWDIQLCSLWPFNLKSFIILKLCVKFSYFEIQNFWIVQTNLGGEMTDNKVLYLDKIYDFVVDVWFIWNYLLPKILFKVLYFKLIFLNYEEITKPNFWNFLYRFHIFYLNFFMKSSYLRTFYFYYLRIIYSKSSLKPAMSQKLSGFN